MTPIRTAIIGFGKIAEDQHVPAIHGNPRFELAGSVSRPMAAPRSGASPFAGADVPETAFALGQRVRHALFGEGVILNYEGSGAQARVQVNFDAEGSKWLMLSYAKLEGL